MEYLKIIKEFNKNNVSLKSKFNLIKNLILYFIRLEKAIYDNTIFSKEKSTVNSINKLFDAFDNNDYQIIDEVLTKNTKNFLKQFKLKNTLDFQNEKDFLQIGINTILLSQPVRGLWNTGKATFYLPILKNKENYLILEIFSIIPNKIFVGQEKRLLETIEIKQFQTLRIELPLVVMEVSMSALLCNLT